MNEARPYDEQSERFQDFNYLDDAADDSAIVLAEEPPFAGRYFLITADGEEKTAHVLLPGSPEQIETHLIEHFGATSIREITEEEFQAFYEAHK